jgi:hypothetical protein
MKSFSEFFNSINDETLTAIAYYSPKQLNALCIMLSLDLQMEAEEQERLQKTKKKKK